MSVDGRYECADLDVSFEDNQTMENVTAANGPPNQVSARSRHESRRLLRGDTTRRSGTGAMQHDLARGREARTEV